MLFVGSSCNPCCTSTPPAVEMEILHWSYECKRQGSRDYACSAVSYPLINCRRFCREYLDDCMTTASESEYDAVIAAINALPCTDETDAINYGLRVIPDGVATYGGRGGWPSCSVPSGLSGYVQHLLGSTPNFGGSGNQFQWQTLCYSHDILSMYNEPNTTINIQTVGQYIQYTGICGLYFPMPVGESLSSYYNVTAATLYHRQAAWYSIPDPRPPVLQCTWTQPSTTYWSESKMTTTYKTTTFCAGKTTEYTCPDATLSCNTPAFPTNGSCLVTIGSTDATSYSDVAQDILDGATSHTVTATDTKTSLALNASVYTTTVASGDTGILIGFKPSTLRYDQLLSIESWPGVNWYNQFKYGSRAMMMPTELVLTHSTGDPTTKAIWSCGTT